MRTLAFWLSLLLVFTIPGESVIEHPVLGSASRTIGLLLAVSWLLAALMAGRARRPTSFHVALTGFAMLNALSVVWTANPDKTMQHIGTWSQLVMMCFIMWDLYTAPRHVFAALQAYVLGAYGVFVNTVANYSSGDAYYYERFSAAGTHPDDLGIVLALGIPIAAYLLAFRPIDRLSMPLKVVNSTYVVAALFGIGLSGTRTAAIAAVPGVVFVFALAMRMRHTAKVVAAVAVAIAWLILLPHLPETSLERLGSTRSEIAGGDLNGRITLWREGIESLKREPLLGVGSNMFRSTNAEGKVAHNSFVSVLVELGTVGMLIYLLVIALAAQYILHRPRWEVGLWSAVLTTWLVGASMLTWEYRKPTWLFLSLIVASANAVPVANVAEPCLPTVEDGAEVTCTWTRA